MPVLSPPGVDKQPQPLWAVTGLDGLAPAFLIACLPIWIKLQDETFFGFLLSVKFKVQMRCEAALSFIRTAAQRRGEEVEGGRTGLKRTLKV